MFGLDLAKADEGVTSLPWVSEVTVERKWPRSILITLKEREPSVIAVIPNGEKFLLDRSGVVLDQVNQNDASCRSFVLMKSGSGYTNFRYYSVATGSRRSDF